MVEDQVRAALLPIVIVEGDTEMVTVGAGAFTVSVAVLLALPPAPLQVSSYESVPTADGVTDWVPLVVSVPVQSPLAVHEVALVEDQVRVALEPRIRLVGETEIVTVRVAGALTVRVVEALPLPPLPVQVNV